MQAPFVSFVLFVVPLSLSLSLSVFHASTLRGESSPPQCMK
jgi:hypothetical protein